MDQPAAQAAHRGGRPALWVSGRTKTDQLATLGEFPVRIIRIDNSYHVPTAEPLRILGVTPVACPKELPRI